MKPSEITVGCTYRNKGAGRTQRKVLGIGVEHRPTYRYGATTHIPDDVPGVLYEDNRDRVDRLFLSAFASWAGSEVSDA